ncbi:MAG: exodeoxyribonuclease III [Gammaproteobacteria bacterium]|nr:exodeoxyribonuclease III [Gammaproteobacteria bacterium]
MRIASWNVNSIRVRLNHVLDWLQECQPDVLGLQEIKLVTEAFPTDDFTRIGYHAAIHGQKTYNGVALLSRMAAEDVRVDIPDFADEQRRVIAGSFGDTRVINVYVPNGQSVGSEKYEYKLGWLEALRDYLEAEMGSYDKLLVMGDFNIAPDDRDVHDPDAWRGKILCSDAEREHLQALEALGLKDAFRLFDQPENSFSWWDYRNFAFRRKLGLRIDLLLVSPALAESCSESGIDVAPRRLERPSDHAPVFAVFE